MKVQGLQLLSLINMEQGLRTFALGLNKLHVLEPPTKGHSFCFLSFLHVLGVSENILGVRT